MALLQHIFISQRNKTQNNRVAKLSLTSYKFNEIQLLNWKKT